MRILTALALLAWGPAGAVERVDAKAAFDRLKSMAGEWRANSSMGEARIRVEVLAGGSAILQRETMGKTEEMVTMFHLDGDRLLLTHYCMVGNQPRMQARAYHAESGELRFEFLDGTSLGRLESGHMHAANFLFLGDGRVRQDWEFFEGGRRARTESLDYRRVAANR